MISDELASSTNLSLQKPRGGGGGGVAFSALYPQPPKYVALTQLLAEAKWLNLSQSPSQRSQVATAETQLFTKSQLCCVELLADSLCR